MSLSKLYDDIVTKANVNHSSREIEDICSAVEEMLERLVSGGIEIYHYEPSFRKVDLQPCGGMAEQTSLWKKTRRQFRQNTFLEFDYLAVLQNEDKVAVLQNEDNVVVLQNEDNVAVLQNEDNVAVLQNEDKVAVLQNEDKVAVLQNEDKVAVLQNEDNVVVLQNEDNVAVLQNEDNVAVLQNEDNVAVLQNEVNVAVLQNEDNWVVLQNEDNVEVLQNEDNVAVLQNEDNVAVLQNEDNVVEIKGGGCQGCRGIYIGDRILSARYFNRVFLEELYSQIHSRCSCCVDPDDTTSEDDRHDSRPCTECTVVKDAGYLQIAKIPDVSQRNVKHSETCSIVFYWTSQTDSLLAPMVETLQPTEKIKRLVIRVDLLPAFEFSSNRDGDQCGIKRFIIAKRCPYCIGLTRNMVSYCMHELNAISHVSDQHRQSYIIIKFLYGQFIYWTGVDWCINNYHAKVAFLTHCQTCTDERKDCTTCITEILQSLVEAYRSKSLRLPEFHPMENLRFDRFGDDDMTSFQIPILSLLHVLSQLKSPNENHQCNSQYRPSHVVGLIKRTNRMLCEQRRPGIVDVDGRLLENTVPALDILGVLLGDKDLCYDAVYECYYGMRDMYDRFPCPEPERGLLLWKAICIGKIIMAIDINDIRDETIKKAVRVVQDFVKKRHERENSYKRLVFLTRSMSVPKMLDNDSENSSLTSSSDGCCNDTGDRRVPNEIIGNKRLVFLTRSQSAPVMLNNDSENSFLASSSDGCCNDTGDSIFNDDLQLNWSAFTQEQTKKVKKYIRRRRRRCILM